LKEVLSNVSAYLLYTVKDGDTPEILAEKVYGSPEAHWLILYANNIVDPQFDWPLNATNFNRFVVDKYRSMAERFLGPGLKDYQIIAWTQDINNIHHYEKVLTRKNSASEIIYEERTEVNFQDILYTTQLQYKMDTYVNLPETESYTTYNFNGQTITEIVKRNAVTYYDYEFQLNENKRNIKIIKAQYYPQINQEFKNLVGTPQPPFIRNLNA
jgi:hypothetical protein